MDIENYIYESSLAADYLTHENRHWSSLYRFSVDLIYDKVLKLRFKLNHFSSLYSTSSLRIIQNLKEPVKTYKEAFLTFQTFCYYLTSRSLTCFSLLTIDFRNNHLSILTEHFITVKSFEMGKFRLQTNLKNKLSHVHFHCFEKNENNSFT